MAARDKRFTIYDMMDKKGAFSNNPANPDSQDASTGEALYQGPVEYPKMFYHPTGERRITVPAEIIETPLGPKSVGEKSEIIWEIAKTKSEEKSLRDLGWHDHPAGAIAAGGGEAPAISTTQHVKNLEEQIRKLQLEKNDSQSRLAPKPSGSVLSNPTPASRAGVGVTRLSETPAE